MGNPVPHHAPLPTPHYPLPTYLPAKASPMATDQANVRELLALKRTLHDALSLAEIRAVNWGAIANASAVALARGWRGDELARFCVEGLDRAEDVGAVIYSTVRDLGTIDPPRDSTPQPPPAQSVLADIHRANRPAANPSQWIAKLRDGGRA